MRKIVFILLLMMALVAIVPAVAATKPSLEIMPYYGGDSFGQNQYYSVVFDEEGDAIVAAKLKIQNTGKDNLTEIEIEIPGESVRIVNMLQEVQQKDKVCSYWEKICTDYDEDSGTCGQYKETCSSWYWQNRWPALYYAIEKNVGLLSKSVRYDLKLPFPIQEQDTGIILVYYKVQGYVDKGIGTYDFDFETIKLNRDVDDIRVSVSVQEGLYLKGGEAKVDYRTGFGALEKAAAYSEGVQSDDLQRFSSQIEYEQGYVKTARGLDPWESFHVNGEYATSWLMLHKLSVFFGSGFVLLILAGIFFGFRKLIQSKGSFASLFGIGSGSAVLLIITWFLFSFLIKNIGRWMDWRNSELVMLLLVLLGGIVTLAMLIGPPLYVGLTSGVKSAFIVLGITIVMLIMLSIIIVIFLSVTQGPQYPMYRVMEALA